MGPVAGRSTVTPQPDRTSVRSPARDRRFTVPNALSFLRLLGVPLFLFLLLGPHADLAALGVLVFAGASDWLDGRLARALNQGSRLGEVLDPLADRLYIVAILIAFVLRDVIPWQFAAGLIARDALLGCCLLVLRRYGYAVLPVHFLGKAATFNLLSAFPFLLLAIGGGVVAAVARPIGWAFAVWGTGLYWWAGVLYVIQVMRLVRDGRRETAA